MKENIFHTTKIVAITTSLMLLLAIAWIDYIFKYDVSLSIFYLIPIVYLSLHRKLSMIDIAVFSVFSAVILVLQNSLSTNRPTINLLIWKGLTDMFYYLCVGILIKKLSISREKLIEQNKILTQLNNDKNRYLGMAAHDLRSPLSSIASLSELLINDSKFKQENQKKHEILEYIFQSAAHGLTLAKNILNISTIESGTVDLTLKNADYISFIKKQIHIIQYLANQKSITFVLETSFRTLSIDFDEVYMQEVLDNLFTNAIKYSYPKSIVIVRVTKDDKWLLTEVIDQGVGIKPHEAKRLFQPFQRASSVPTSGESSTGLGLAIIKKIIELHHGNIGVQTNNAVGSTFFFKIPITADKISEQKWSSKKKKKVVI